MASHYNTPCIFTELSAVSDTPASGTVYLYAKDDSLLYIKDSSGTETDISTGGGGSGMSNPMSATGDIIYGGASGTPMRLAIGTDSYALRVVSGSPVWRAEGAVEGAGEGWNIGSNTVAGNSTAVGKNNTASHSGGMHSYVFGNNNYIYSGGAYGESNIGGECWMFGRGNTSGNGSKESTAIGYAGNVGTNVGYSIAIQGGSVTANYSAATGHYALANRIGMDVFSMGQFAARGDAQAGRIIYRAATTNATQTELTSDGSAPSGTTITTSNRFIIADGQAIMCDVYVVAKDDSGAKAGCYQRRCLILRESSTTSIVGAVQTIGTDIETPSDTAWDVTLAADDTNESLQVLVTGAAATNIRWVAEITFREVSY